MNQLYEHMEIMYLTVVLLLMHVTCDTSVDILGVILACFLFG